MLALNQISQEQNSIRASSIEGFNVIGNVINMPSSQTGAKGIAEDDALERLIDIWRKLKDRRTVQFSWRARIQYQVFKFDHSQKSISPCTWQQILVHRAASSNYRFSEWKEASFQHGIEASPSRPYSPQLTDFMRVETDLILQRKALESLLDNDHGCFTFDSGPVPSSSSLFSSSSLTSMNGYHASDVQRSALSNTLHNTAANLAVTFNAHDLREARYLHDQLYVLSPIMLALTASSLAGVDDPLGKFVRRYDHSTTTNDELEAAYQQEFTASPSSPIYLSADGPRSDSAKRGIDQRVFWRLRREGFDDVLATLFAGNSFNSQVTSESDQRKRTGFCAADATNFIKCFDKDNQHVTLLLPSLTDPDTGFGVEFRGMNTQLTDFANSACVFFVGLLRFAILGFDLDFRMPSDLVADNLRRCRTKDAVLTEKFWWRMPRWRVRDLHPFSNDQYVTTDIEPTLASVDHIMNGDPSRPETIGLSGVLEAYLADSDDGCETGRHTEDFLGSGRHANDMSSIPKYLAFLRTRAKGTTWTDARWIDSFIRGHPKHSQQGVDPETIFDLLSFIREFHS